MDLLGAYGSGSDDEEVTVAASSAASPGVQAVAVERTAAAVGLFSGTVPQPQATSAALNLAALLPPAHTPLTSLDAEEDGASRKRRKLEKQEKRERKEAKRQRREEAATAHAATPVMPPPVLAPTLTAGKFGLSAMLPPPKFDGGPAANKTTPSFRETNPLAHTTTPAMIVDEAPPPAPAMAHSQRAVIAVATPTPAPATATAVQRAPPGMRPPPGMRANPPPAAAAAAASSEQAAAGVSSVAVASVSSEATYEDALKAAQAFATAASSDDAAQDAVNAELARNPGMLDDDSEEPYVPLYARTQAQVPKGVKSDNFSAELGDLTGQDKYFKRVLGSEINFLSVNQSDLTHRSLGEQLMAQFEEKNPPPGTAATKVQAKFWNSQTGATEATTDISATSKRKHQINTLASSAAAMEVELARQRQAGYAKRDGARKKYGW